MVTVRSESRFSSMVLVMLASITATGRAVAAAADAAAARTTIQAVGLTGDEIVAGKKTFTSGATFEVATAGNMELTAVLNIYPGMIFRKNSGALVYRSQLRSDDGRIRIGTNPDGSSTSSPTNWIDVYSNMLAPSPDNTFSCGSSTLRFTQFWAVNSTIGTSDARLKTEPRQLRDAEFKAASAIARLPAVWRWLNRVHGDENCEPEGREARKHFGPTVQAAIAVMEDHGLDPFAYSFICYDEWEEEEATYDEDGNELNPSREAGDRYSFRKEELLCFIVRALAQEIDGLAERVAALEAKA